MYICTNTHTHTLSECVLRGLRQKFAKIGHTAVGRCQGECLEHATKKMTNFFMIDV